MTANQAWIGWLLAALGALALFMARPAAAIEARSGPDIELSGPREELVFASGERVRMGLQSSADAFVAAEKLNAAGAQVDRLIAAAGEVDWRDTQAANLLLLAGEAALLSGLIGEDLIVAAGSLQTAPALQVQGAAVLAARDLELRSPVAGEVAAVGRDVLLDAAFGSDVEVSANRLVLGPNARIAGDLRHRSRSLEIAPGAQVAGQTIALPVSARPMMAEWRAWGRAAMAWMALAFFAGVFVLAVGAALLFPGLLRGAELRMRTAPWPTFGIGALAALFTPLIIALLFASFLGAALGLLLAVLLAAAGLLAFSSVVYAAGQYLRRLAARGREDYAGPLARVGWTALALVVFFLVGLVPFLGPALWFLALVFGLGAVLREGYGRLARAPPEPQPA